MVQVTSPLKDSWVPDANPQSQSLLWWPPSARWPDPIPVTAPFGKELDPSYTATSL